MKTFEEKVLEIVRQIPYGRVTTYGLIARAAGSPRSARTVGWILNRQKFNFALSAHRVVNRKGQLTGKMHFETPDLMQKLLENEGMLIENDQIINFESKLWYPKIAENK